MTALPEPGIPPCQIIATRDETSPVWRFFLVNAGDAPIERAVLAAVKYEWGDQYWGEGESPGVEVVDLLPGDRALIWEDDGSSEMRTDLWLRVAQGAQDVVLLFEFPKLYRQPRTTLTADPNRMDRLP